MAITLHVNGYCQDQYKPRFELYQIPSSPYPIGLATQGNPTYTTHAQIKVYVTAILHKSCMLESPDPRSRESLPLPD